MKVTVITPFYYGNDYIRGFEKMMEANEQALGEGDELEVIIVNDSPQVAVGLSGVYASRDNWRLVTHQHNKGIHAARLSGLDVAGGEYILFLDQDDVIEDDAIAKMLAAMKALPKDRKQVVVTNAWMGYDGGKKIRYRTSYQKRHIDDLNLYVAVGTQIISPGHCLIPKELIPVYWKKHTLTINGADDMMLWLLMLAKGTGFSLLDEPLYEHRYTAKNLSGSTEKMDDSYYEMIYRLKSCTYFPKGKLTTLKRMVDYKAEFRAGGFLDRIFASFAHPVLAFINLRYQIGKRFL